MALGKKTGGRKKGTPNKRTEGLKEVLDSLGVDPIRNLAKASTMAEADGDWNLFYNVNKELAQYIYPKRKAVEVTGHEGGPIETKGIQVVGVSSAADT